MAEDKLAKLIRERAKNIPIEEVRVATAGIKGSLSDMIIRMRHGDEE